MPEPEPYRLSWTTEYRDLREAVAWNMRHRRRWPLLTLSGLVVAMVLVWLALAIVTRSPNVPALLVVVGYGLLAIFLPHLSAWSAWNVTKKAASRGTEVMVSDDGVHVRNGATESRYGWSDLLAPERSRRVWVFPPAHAKGAVFLPVRAVTGAEEEFAAYVREWAATGGSAPR